MADRSPADIARRGRERQFGRDLEALAPTLHGWADRAAQFELYGLEDTLRQAADHAALWAEGLLERVWDE